METSVTITKKIGIIQSSLNFANTTRAQLSHLAGKTKHTGRKKEGDLGEEEGWCKERDI
jgi:hypothetical protein